MIEQTRRLIRWIRARLFMAGKRDLLFLVLLALLAGGAWLFVVLANGVTAGRTDDLDRAILLALRNPQDLTDPIGPEMLEEIGRDLTAVGGGGVMAFLVAAVIGYLLLQGKRRMALLMAASIGSGGIFSLLLKSFFERARPDFIPHGSYTYTTSFPSGHTLVSAVVYLTLAALLARNYQRTRVKLYFLVLAVVLTGLVGVSRVYLGVHWPTDVLAGWTAGAFWATLWWGIGYILQRRGRVEQEEPGS